MASISKLDLLEATALTASITTDAQALTAAADDFIAFLNVSANNGTTTVDATVQHSPDKTNWITVATFTQIVNVTGTQAILHGAFATANQPLFPNVRSVVTLGGTPSATVAVQLWFKPGFR